MTHLDLRKKYFDFWTNKPRNSMVVPPSPIVPLNDPTTLFTGSGMQQFIPYFLGESHPLGKRLVDIQPSFRGQGFTDDTMEVGDNRHLTLFEMLGNWSLGDYFKKEQLTWYYELITEVLKLDPEKIYVTCFEGNDLIPKDTESADVWKSLGISQERIYFYGVDKNWWSRSGTPEQMPVGEIGGPDSEVYYDFGTPHDPKFGKECHPACDCGRFMEFGNSVFIQYRKISEKSFEELPQKNVDFGGGLERTLAVINGNPDIYVTDLYFPIIQKLEHIFGQKYDAKSASGKIYKVLADHIKASVFLIDAGVLPSNKDRGYVLRRLIRRMIRFSLKLSDQRTSFLDQLGDVIIKNYKETYPTLIHNSTNILDVLQKEEKKFNSTLEKGLKEFQKIAAGGKVSADQAFYLYESFGFPYELSEEEAQNENITIASKSEFDEEVKKHQDLSRIAGTGMFKGGLADQSETVVKYHTATHLLQAALRKVLGNHVHQEGSNLTGERLRFDFTHGEKLTPEQLKEVEDLVNKWVSEGHSRKVETMSYEEAIKDGALAFFKERYPEKVTVYSFGEVSKEICGGPHVENTSEIGHLTIYKEEAVSAGIRRIYAKV